MPFSKTRQEAEAYLPGKSYLELSDDWKLALQELRHAPGTGFSAEQLTMLAGWALVVPTSRLAELDNLQAGKTILVAPTLLMDGTFVLLADTLTDIRPGEPMAHLGPFLATLKFRLLADSDWPPPMEI